jgi:GTP-binding protein Era
MYRCGFVGLIGQPNAGKSTLMNILVKEKVSIVTPKPQTTRRRILGIVSNDQGQVVFVDAPGVLKAGKGLNAFLTQEAHDVIAQSDLLIAVVGLDTESKEQAEEIINMVAASGKPWMGVITKVDLTEFLRRKQSLRELFVQHKSCLGIIETSSTWKQDAEGVREEILRLSFSKLPETPEPLYDIELFTPHTVKDMVSEIVREQCFEVLHQEIPYQIAVRIQKFDEEDPTMPKIYAEILVAKASHKPILIGKGGATIKEIGTLARKAIEKLMGHKVFLGLSVAIREDWYENKNLMKELGYVVDTK